jgi:hypothetical protein
MTSQWKSAILLTLAWFVIDGAPWAGPVLAADERVPAKVAEKEFEKASKEALELLRRDAAKLRPDWVAVATANADRWSFTLIYTRGKGLAHPNLSKTNPAARHALPPLTDLVLPRNGSVELNVTSNDGIHALEVPGLGIKANALPGRIERIVIDTAKPGVFPSTCPEPCTAKAKGMAFAVHVVDTDTFRYWLVAREARAADLRQPPEGDEFSGATCGVGNLGFSIRDTTKSISVNGGDGPHFTFRRGMKIGSGKFSNIHSIEIEANIVIIRLNDTFADDPIIRRFEFRNLPEHCVRDIDAVVKMLHLPK